MDETKPRQITVRLVEDPTPEARAARLTELLATGIARLLQKGAAVDFGREMSVHDDEGIEHRPW
ncbi:MAG: hypothetical protein EXR66_08585 [Dehalococcoidia bacterium]|nr:hypothetical protein [Dehalococcoidia bacterium]